MYLVNELWLAIRLSAGVLVQGQFWLMLLRQLSSPPLVAVVASMFGFAYLSPYILVDFISIFMVAASTPSLPALAGLACLLFMVVAAVPLLARAWCPIIARQVLAQMQADLPEVALPGTGRFIASWLGLLLVLLLLSFANIAVHKLLPQFSQPLSYGLMFLMLVAGSGYQVACALCQHGSRADIAYVKQATFLRRALLWSLLIYLLWALAGYFFAPKEAAYIPFKPFEVASAGHLLLDVLSKLVITAVAMVLWAALSLPVLAARQGLTVAAAAPRAAAGLRLKRAHVLLLMLAAVPLAYFARFSLLHVYLKQTDDMYARYSTFDAGASHRSQLTDQLYRSACDGEPPLKLLLRAGVPGKQDGAGQRLGAELQCAAAKGRLDTVAYLLEQGASVNAYGPLGREYVGKATALHAAVLQRNVAMVELLLRHGADPTLRAQSSGDAGTPLQTAAALGELKLFDMLVKAGADLKGEEAQTLLHHYVGYLARRNEPGRPHWAALLDEAIASGMPLKGKDKDGRTLLHLAAMLGEFELIDILLERGFDRLAPDAYGARPFMNLAYWYANRTSINPGPELESTLLVLSIGAPDLNARVEGKAGYWLGMQPLPPSWSLAHAAVAKRRLRKRFEEQVDYSALTVDDFASYQALASEGAAEDLVSDLSAAQLQAALALGAALERRGWPQLARQAGRR